MGKNGEKSAACIVLCAGRGTRMGSQTLPKVCFPIGGVPAVNRIVRTCYGAGVRTVVVVVGASAGQVVETVGKEFPEAVFVYQREQRGTGDATRVGLAPLERVLFDGPVIVTAGDKHIEPSVLSELTDAFYRTDAHVAFVVSRKQEPTEMGRVATRPDGSVLGIFECINLRRARAAERVRACARKRKQVPSKVIRRLLTEEIASHEKLGPVLEPLWHAAGEDQSLPAKTVLAMVPESAARFQVGKETYTGEQLERLSRHVNESLYVFKPDVLADGLADLMARPGQKEEYLTDVINALIVEQADGRRPRDSVQILNLSDSDMMMGFNTPDQLLAIEEHVSRQKAPTRRKAFGDRLGRRNAKTVREWTRLFASQSKALQRRLREVYGADDDVLKERTKAYLTALRVFGKRYGTDTRAVIVRAPGTVNLMGRHIDNQGGCINLMTINKEVIVVAAPREDDRVRVINTDAKAFQENEFAISDEVAHLDWDDWLSYVQSRHVQRMIQSSRGDWTHYVRAAVLRLQQAFREVPLRGMDCVFHGNIPVAAGLSASSAVVVSAMEAVIALNGLGVPPEQFVDMSGEGEWYTGTQTAAAGQAGMRFGQRGAISRVHFLPFEVERGVDFSDAHRVVICHSHARPRRVARDFKGKQVAAFEMGMMFVKDRFPQHVHLLEHLRDLTPKRLGISLRAFYSLLRDVPMKIARGELTNSLSAVHRERLSELFETHADSGEYDLRSLLLFGAAECARAEMFGELLASGQFDRIGRLMGASHDAERVVRHDAQGRAHAFDALPTDERLSALIDDLNSEDPDRVARAQLYVQPGRYGSSRRELDAMVDSANAVPGVVGAQLSGAGLGGCIMVLCASEAVARLRRELSRSYYRPRKLRPDIAACMPIEGVSLLST